MTRHSAAQKGAALLSAMLTVALVASLASAALWQQWRQVEIETAERGRSQTQWLMTGALDWSRLILREDALSGQGAGMDHLGEPWALPVQESKLSSFLSQDQQWREGDAEVFLSGQITDAQSRMNVMNLIEDGKLSAPALARFARLFQRLDLPLSELQSLASQLLVANANMNAPASAGASPTTAPRTATANAGPLLPRQTEQLAWLGLSAASLAALRPYITVLPKATPVNLNTAPALVLEAMLPALDAASARQLVSQRERKPLASLDALRESLGPVLSRGIEAQQHSVNSQFFEIRGRMRIDQVVQEEVSLVQRESGQVRMLWRTRNPVPAAMALPLQ